VFCLALVYVAVRFAPAAATSVAEKRFAFFDAWKVSRGRFWSLLGAFAILYLMLIVGYFIFAIAFGLAFTTTLMTALGGAHEGAPAASIDQVMQLLLTPSFLVPIGIFYLIIIAAVMSFFIALLGVNARAAQAALEEGKIAQAT
jgi:hypothetical protein